MKHETAGFLINKFVGLKPKRNSFLVDDNNKHKKAKTIHKNVVATISQDEYKDVKIIEWEFTKSTNQFLFLALMINYTCKTMDMID